MTNLVICDARFLKVHLLHRQLTIIHPSITAAIKISNVKSGCSHIRERYSALCLMSVCIMHQRDEAVGAIHIQVAVTQPRLRSVYSVTSLQANKSSLLALEYRQPLSIKHTPLLTPPPHPPRVLSWIL